MYIIHNVFIWVLALYTFLLMQLDCALMLYNSMCTLLSSSLQSVLLLLMFIEVIVVMARNDYHPRVLRALRPIFFINSQLMYAMRRWILMMMSCICYVFLSMHKLSINIQSENVVGCICIFILRPVTYLFVLYTSTGWWKRSLRCSQPYSMWYSFCCFWSSSFPFLVNMYCHL